MTPFRLAWLNLSRRPFPTMIALLAIALSVASSGILRRLEILARDRFDRLANQGEAIVGAKSGGIEMILGALGLEGEYPDFVPQKLYESLRAERSVNFADGANVHPVYMRAIYPFLYFGRVEFTRAIGTDAEIFARPDHEMRFAEGRAFSREGEIVIGHRVANVNHWHLGDRILVTPWAGEADDALSPEMIEFTISGILSPTHSAWDAGMFASIPDAKRVLNSIDLRSRSIWGADVLHYFLVDFVPGAGANGFTSLAGLVNRRTVAQAISVGTEKSRLRHLTGTGKQIGNWLAGFVLGLGALAAAGMLMTRFEAMALQLAVLRAIGYTRGAITGWLVSEGLLLGTGATFIGAILDFALFPLVRHALGETLPSEALVPSSLFNSAPVWAVAVSATTLSVTLPLWRAYRQDVGLTLRS